MLRSRKFSLVTVVSLLFFGSAWGYRLTSIFTLYRQVLAKLLNSTGNVTTIYNQSFSAVLIRWEVVSSFREGVYRGVLVGVICLVSWVLFLAYKKPAKSISPYVLSIFIVGIILLSLDDNRFHLFPGNWLLENSQFWGAISMLVLIYHLIRRNNSSSY